MAQFTEDFTIADGDELFVQSGVGTLTVNGVVLNLQHSEAVDGTTTTVTNGVAFPFTLSQGTVLDIGDDSIVIGLLRKA